MISCKGGEVESTEHSVTCKKPRRIEDLVLKGVLGAQITDDTNNIHKFLQILGSEVLGTQRPNQPL